MTKVVLLGAGSGFTPGLARDMMLINGLRKGELALVDTDGRRLATIAKTVRALAEHMQAEHGRTWTITPTTERKDVLKGADYVVNCIEVSGVASVRYENDIPLKYGIDQCIGDTIGPGGIFKALRTVPTWLEILADIERLCPKALVMNYTNPMSIMTLAAVRATQAQVVGLCHSVQGTSRELANVAGVPYDKLRFRCAGINHLAWFTELTFRGRNLYPKIFKRARSEKEVYERDPVRFDMMFHFGAFVTESSGHLSEYLPYYRKRPDLLKTYCRDGYRGGSSFYADNWPTWRKESDKRRRALARDITGMSLERGYEYASEIIEAHRMNEPRTIYGSVANQGLIPNLPADGVVEVATMINGTGYNPCRFGPLPPQMAAICDGHMRVYDLVVRGIMQQDRDAVYHAMMLDPLSAACCSPAELCAMTDELAWAEKAYLPRFMTKGLKRPTRTTTRRRPGGAVRRQHGRTRDRGPFQE